MKNHMNKNNLEEIKKSILFRYGNNVHRIPAKFKIFFNEKSNIKSASITYINYLIFNSYYIYK